MSIRLKKRLYSRQSSPQSGDEAEGMDCTLYSLSHGFVDFFFFCLPIELLFYFETLSLVSADFPVFQAS